MKATKLGKLKDGALFQISKRSTAATYKVIRKDKGKVIYTSIKSERSFSGAKDLQVYTLK